MRASVLLNNVLIALLAASLAGCFLTDVLPRTPSKKKTGGQSPSEAPPTLPLLPKGEPLSPERLARRLSLDLLRSLPPAVDVEELVVDPAVYGRHVAGYLASPAAAQAVAGWHRTMWRLSPDRLPELARLAEDDDALAEALTPALRWRLVEEPLLRLRYVLETRRPFSDLFDGTWSILHPDAAAFYELPLAEAPWTAEPYRFVVYDDGRPAAGLLVANALLATHPAGTEEPPRHRASAIVRRFTCLSPEQAAAHTFHDLTVEELAGDLASLASTRSPCRGCHAHWDDYGVATHGLGSGDDLATWRVHRPGETTAGHWSGRPFEDGAALGALFGRDPRVHRCEIERLAAYLLQRHPSPLDAKPLALAIDAFHERGQSVLDALPALLMSDAYKVGPIPKDAAVELLRDASGVRFLRREQWRGVLRELTRRADQLVYPETLDAGADEVVGGADGVPTGRYWRAVEVLARQAATAIVADELHAAATAATRRTLTLLPDGSAATASNAVAMAQVAALWRKLTGDALVAGLSPHTELVQLWEGASTDRSDDGARRAWRTMLVGILTHPHFLTY